MAKTEVRRSPIGGLGVFTLDPLRAGELVREFVLEREVTPEAPPRPEEGDWPDHCPWIDGRHYLVGSPERYLNHSCDPNVYLRFEDGRIDVVARRAVEAGAELTLDYLINNPGGESWPCRCGAERCRGETGQSFFTLPAELQREYAPLLAPWFRRRYARDLGGLAAPFRRPGEAVSAPELELRHHLSRDQVDELVALYRNEWWTRGRDAESVEAMLASSSLLFALVDPASERLGAFARVLTDRVYVALLLDVIVAPELRGRGVGRRIMEAVLAHRGVASVQSVELACQPPLVPFYRKWGFVEQPGGSTLMRRTASSALLGSRDACG